MVLSACDRVEGQRRAEELAHTLASARLAVNQYEHCVVSVSIGVAAYPVDGRSYPELLAVADARMYSRKRAPGVAVRLAERPAAGRGQRAARVV